nr:unnamed protein product [Spirometra erinaceieuropaei]
MPRIEDSQCTLESQSTPADANSSHQTVPCVPRRKGRFARMNLTPAELAAVKATALRNRLAELEEARKILCPTEAEASPDLSDRPDCLIVAVRFYPVDITLLLLQFLPPGRPFVVHSHLLASTTILAAYEVIQEGQLFVLFLLHRKLYVREDRIQTFFECQQLIPVDNDEVIASQFLFFFAVYRLLDLTGADGYKIPSVEYRIPTYATTVVVFSVIITSPQTFSVNLVNDDCNCSSRKINIPLLSLIYAQVYVWIAILIVFDGTVLTYIGFRLWRSHSTPTEFKREDKMEQLHFYNTAFTEINMSGSTAVCNSSWITGSMCVIPLSISYLVLFSYDQIYQFASAVDLLTYAIGTRVQKFGGLLIVLHCAIVPIIVIIFIRPLRLGVVKYWRMLTSV